MRSSRAINNALEELFRREDEGTAFSSGVETIPLYSEMEKWMLTKKYKCIAEAKAARGSPTSLTFTKKTLIMMKSCDYKYAP